MNNPTTILEQAQQWIGAAGRRGAMVTRRCVCVLALVLLFLAASVGGLPSRETGAQGFGSLFVGAPALADTSVGTDQERVDERGSYEGVRTTTARHKTH